MKTVARVLWIHEADLIKAKLELHDIAAFIPDEGMATANPLLGTAIGGIRVQVADEDEARAREVLAAEAVASEDTNVQCCPACGSEDTTYGVVPRRWFFASLLLLGFPLIWLKKRYECRACGHRWMPE